MRCGVEISVLVSSIEWDLYSRVYPGAGDPGERRWGSFEGWDGGYGFERENSSKSPWMNGFSFKFPMGPQRVKVASPRRLSSVTIRQHEWEFSFDHFLGSTRILVHIHTSSSPAPSSRSL